MVDFNPKLIDPEIRLRVMSILARVDRAEFMSLLDQTHATANSLSAHLRKLRAAGYIQRTPRENVGMRGPVSDYSITGKGREALAAYTQQMHAFAQMARRGLESAVDEDSGA